jgi:glycosyltransferase involved in cell wall biosynthesis
MNILIIGTAYPLRGGIAHFNALLAEHLGKRHTVETITFKRQYPKILFPGTTQEEQGEQLQVPPAPELMDSINPLNWLRVAREVRKRNPDLIIMKYWMPFFAPCFGTIAKFSKQGAKVKVLFICDNIIPHERRIGDVALTRYAFRQGDYFVVQSAAVERDLNENFPGVKYRNIPHPVYENFGAALPKQEARTLLGISAKKVILYFGYVRAYKGLNVLIDAMRYVDDVLLLAVGEFYDDERKYRQQVADLGLNEKIRFVSDYIPNDNVGAYFSAADAVVLPYLSGTQSGIIQIAYNFNTPVIATDVGGFAEVVVDNKTGYIVPPNNPKALADAIRQFYEQDRGPVFSEHIKTEKQKYSWDHFVKSIEELVKG